MALAELVNDRIEIDAEFREKELVKLVPGARWDTDRGIWHTPVSWAACQQLRGIFGEGLRVGAALGAWTRAERDTRVAPCLALRTAEDAPGLQGLFGHLKPFQRSGVQFLALARRALLADEMGLGKTVQGIATLELLDALSKMEFEHQVAWVAAELGVTLTEPMVSPYPALIVCPNSMKMGWQAEFAKFAPGRECAVIAGTPTKKKAAIESVKTGIAQVAIINYEALRSHTRLAGYGTMTLSDADKLPKELNEIPWATVLADEAHRVKDPQAKQTRALWWVGQAATYRFALTGTPIANSPEDAWALMRFVSPEEFPAKTKFIERYAQEAYNVFGYMQIIGIKSETSAELFKILDPRFIRRTKAAVLPQLPPKTYSQRFVEMSPKQKTAYESMRKHSMTELENGILLATNPLTRMTRLIQFASAYGEIDAEDNLILTAPSCKVEALLDVADELGDQQALVFAESRQLIELAVARLLKEGIPCGQITGAVPIHDRHANVQAFQEHRTKLLLMTLGAGAEGLSFPGCSTEIFLQRSFSLVKNTQAEDRCHGMGRGVEGTATNIIDLITADSAESRVHAAGVYKAEISEEICRDAATLKTWLSK